MPTLSDRDAATWFGGNVPSSQQVNDDANRYSKDPFALWWDTFLGGKGVPSQMLGASGVGPKPIRSPNEAGALAGALGLQSDVRNADALNNIFMAGVAQPNRANPYSAAIADQSRGNQLGLIDQMRTQMSGPSIAAMQGQRALGQSGQQALQAAAMGAPGRAGMVQAGGIGAGLAGDTAKARLAEVMRVQAGLGGAAGNLRSGDLRSADAQARMGLAQMQQDEARRQMYARMGLNLQGARNQGALQRDITYYQGLTRRTAQDKALAENTAQGAATLASFGMTGGKK